MIQGSDGFLCKVALEVPFCHLILLFQGTKYVKLMEAMMSSLLINEKERKISMAD